MKKYRHTVKLLNTVYRYTANLSWPFKRLSIFRYLCISSFCILFSFAFSVPTFAQDLPTSITIKPSLGLSLSSSSVMLSLDPTTTPFASETIDVVVGTNNPTGYWLTMSSNNDDTSLVNINDTTKTIPTLESDALEANFPVNHWGYKISSNSAGNDDANYLPYISGTTIASNNSKVNNDTTNLTIASKVDYLSVPGIYKQTFNFTALPHITNYYMQDLSTPAIAQEVCKSDESTMVMDKRDGHIYAIARLKDGKCWMIQNLRLGENLEPTTGELILTEEDTDINIADTYNPRSIFVLTNRSINGKVPAKQFGEAYIWDDAAFYCDDYGCFYNWYTATAGVKSGDGNVALSNADVTTSICPKGWILPTDGAHGASHHSDIRAMLDAYGFNTDSTANVISKLLVNPINAVDNINGLNKPGFVLSGWHSSNGGLVVGDASAIISRSYTDVSGRVYNFYFTKTDLRAVDTGHTANALTVRCLLKE